MRLDVCDFVGEEFICSCLVRFEFCFFCDDYARGCTTDGNSAEVIDFHFVNLSLVHELCKDGPSFRRCRRRVQRIY